jgi:hypothetical protein
MQFSDVIFQEQQGISFVKLMIANDQDGILKLVNEKRILPASPKQDTLAD